MSQSALIITCDDLVHSVDKAFLVVWDETDEPSSFLVVQQHQHFNVALSIVAEMDAAREASLHNIVKRFQR